MSDLGAIKGESVIDTGCCEGSIVLCLRSNVCPVMPSLRYSACSRRVFLLGDDGLLSRFSFDLLLVKPRLSFY